MNEKNENKRKKGVMNDSDARCPFFREHTSMTIACESPVPGGALRMTFKEQSEKNLQYGAFCCKRYKTCEIYRMVMEKYE